MIAVRLKFKDDVIEIEDFKLIDYDKLNSIVDSTETEIVNNIKFYGLNKNEFIIVANNIEDIFKEIFCLFDNFKEILLIITKFAKHLKKNNGVVIDPKEITIKLFPHLYIKYLNNKNKEILNLLKKQY